MGGAQVAGARQILEEAGIPVFRTPDTVIELFHNISTYYQNQKLLLQVPSPGRPTAGGRSGSGRVLVDALIAERRRVLSRMEAHALLHTYGVPVRPSMVAHTATEAMFVAEQIGLPVDVHLESPDLADAFDEQLGLFGFGIFFQASDHIEVEHCSSGFDGEQRLDARVMA